VATRRRPAAATLCAVLGLALNPWFVGLVAAGGSVDTPSLFWAILLWEGLLLSIALYLWSANRIWLLATVGLGFVVIAVSGVGGVAHLEARRAAHERDRLTKTLTRKHALLAHFLQMDASKVASLGNVSSRLQYSLGEPIEVVPMEIPEAAVLETAVGIDPGLFDLARSGSVSVSISISGSRLPERELYSRTIRLEDVDQETLSWVEIEIDLSSFSGQQVNLSLAKFFAPGQGSSVGSFFDLEPIDAVLWRRPRVRTLHPSSRTNVILLSVDTLREDHIGLGGYARPTSPNLDRWAESAVVFSNCISQAPWTTPSHWSIFTGTYPHVHGGDAPYQSESRWWGESLPTMAEIFAEHGYRTAAFTAGGQVSAKLGFSKGFDSYAETLDVEHSVKEVIDRSTEWLRKNRGRSFFLFLHTYEPHRPYTGDYFVASEESADWTELDYEVARYDGDIRYTDQQLDRLIGVLDKTGLLETTLIVLTSDHGEEFLEDDLRFGKDVASLGHGHTLYDEILRVPLAFWGLPGERGETFDAQVRSIDILPTVLDYAGLPLPDALQGASVRSIIEAGESDRPAYSEGTTYGTERESLRAGGFKYIQRLSYGQLGHLSSAGLPLSPLEELYDLSTDPEEKVNLADRMPEMVEELRRWMLSLTPEKVRDRQTRSADTAQPGRTSPEFLESLRALGYVQ